MKSAFMPKLLHWLDEHILLILAGFLLAFIPLYPKIPVWSPIEQYIVRVRLEDFVLLFTVVVWAIQVLRKKVAWKSWMFWAILAYSVVSFLSLLSAIFITHTIPLQPLHVEKSALHFFRYLEYFSFFFILFGAVKKRRDVLVLISIFALTVIGVSVYGYGQKYWYWPVYSTMNREFSKGVRLYLTPHARVQSTFAGHYDMAAYLVIALPLLLAIAYQVRDRRAKYFFHASFWIGTWLIIESASRSSFVAFLGSLFLVILFTSLVRKEWRDRLLFIFSRTIFVFGFSTILFVVFGADLSERLSQIIDTNPTVHNAYHALNKDRKDFTDYLMGKRSETVIAAATPPPGAISTDEAIQLGILTPTDQVPETTKPANRPADVYKNIPDIQLVATTSANGVTTYKPTEVPRTYSDNAIKYGLSMGIRLDTLWPNAIKGFESNPLLGKGYATLNKATNDQFTEADSTDDNFLRTLGETGLLGFITFYGCVAVVLYTSYLGYKKGDMLDKALSIGVFSGTIGLLLNAIYIDVFASSKVALTFWGLAGILISYNVMLKVIPVSTITKKKVKK